MNPEVPTWTPATTPATIDCLHCGGSEFADGLGSVCDECEPAWAAKAEERCDDCNAAFEFEPHDSDCDWWLPPITGAS